MRGRCRAFSADLGAALVVPEDGPGASVIELPSGEARALPVTVARVSAAAFDACGESVVVAGPARSEAAHTYRVERVFLDGRPPRTLHEAPIEGTELDALEVDDRGWVLATIDGASEAPSVWVTSLGGGTVHTLALGDDIGRIYGVVLGP